MQWKLSWGALLTTSAMLFLVPLADLRVASVAVKFVPAEGQDARPLSSVQQGQCGLVWRIARMTPLLTLTLGSVYPFSALASVTWVLGPTGSLTCVELPGPDGFAQWLTCWRAFVTAANMLGAAKISALQAYERNFETLCRIWGAAWHLLVLADDKCRAKHTERIKRQLLTDEAVGKVMPTDWSKDKPWSCVLRLATEGTSSKASSPAGPSKGNGKNKTKTGFDRNGKQIWHIICHSWNNANGQCANIKSGAAHVCLKCGSSDHPAHACITCKDDLQETPDFEKIALAAERPEVIVLPSNSTSRKIQKDLENSACIGVLSLGSSLGRVGINVPPGLGLCWRVDPGPIADEQNYKSALGRPLETDAELKRLMELGPVHG
eukprot:5607103-Amphidinium_carterae.1